MPRVPEPSPAGLRAAQAERRRTQRLLEKDLARRMVFAIALYVAALGVSVLIPFVFSREYFRDGAYIVGIPGSATDDADSYEVTAFLLTPMFELLRFIGIDLSRYGVVFNLDMFVTNTAFGTLGFLFVIGVLLAYRLPRNYGWDAVRLVPVVVLLGPFVFSISKETVTLVVAGVVLLVARSAHWPPWVTCLAWAAALVGLSQLLRAYYLATAVLIVAGFLWARSPRRVVLLYVAFFLSLVVLYPYLPLDDITAGRAEALANVSGSRISYPVDDSGPVGFMVSRSYAFLTLMLPVELGLRSVVYLPYVALQLLMTWRIVQVVRARTTGMTLLSLHTVLAFTAVGALYEPDFGSYFRHKVGTLLFLLVLMSAVEVKRLVATTPEAEPEAEPDDESGSDVSRPDAAGRPRAAGRAAPGASSRRTPGPTRRRSTRPAPP